MEIRHDGSLVWVRFPSGRVDGTAVTTLYETAAQLVSGRDTRLLVDLTDVNYINSGGVGIMVTLQRRALMEGAQFHLVIPSPRVRETFDVMHLDKVLNIFSDVDTALAAFRR
jgi:anti-sigma B factor antagonist